jgi:hypothetical protein
MPRLLGRKQARQEAEAAERAKTSEWLTAVMSATGDAALVRPLRHAPVVNVVEFAEQEAPAKRASRRPALVSSGIA